MFGPTKLKDGSPDPQAGDLPVDRLEIIGNAFGEFNIEKYAALRPELLVSNMFVDGELFYVPRRARTRSTGSPRASRSPPDPSRCRSRSSGRPSSPPPSAPT